MLKKFVALILADQITKAIFASSDFFIGPLRFHLVKNYGLSFGLNNANSLLSLAIVLLAFFLFAVFFYKRIHGPAAVGYVMVVAGAASNLADRLMFGFVRDFLDARLFTFNLADCMVIAGLGVMLWSFRKTYSGSLEDNTKNPSM